MARKTWMLLILLGCGVKQPIEIIGPVTPTGSIYINSQPSGAQIFVDQVNTGCLTPDTIRNIPIGLHQIEVFRDGYQNPAGSVQLNVKQDSTHNLAFNLEKIIEFGLFAIHTSPDGAAIFIDDQFTGKYSPDTLQLESGNYRVSVQKNGFLDYQWETKINRDSLTSLQIPLEVRQTVLMESFGNVSCQPCTTAAHNLDQFTTANPDKDFAVMEYYAYWPKTDDPFYKESPNDVKERLNYYSVFTLPTLKMDGIRNSDASQYASIEADFLSLSSAHSAPLAISLSERMDGCTLTVTAEIHDMDNLLSNPQLRLFIAVSEDSIHYSSPPGDNGLKDFNYVFRRFLTSKTGDAIVSGSGPVAMDYQISWPDDWNYSNANLIAFIQDISNKQVIQTTVK